MSLAACGTQKQEVTATDGTSMKNAFERLFTPSQFDSICVADSLPSDLNKWHRMAFRDHETRKGEYEYLFIKRLGKGEQVYRLEKIGTSYKITKREIR